MKAKRRKSKRRAVQQATVQPAVAPSPKIKFSAIDAGIMALAFAALSIAYLAALYAVASGKTGVSPAIYTDDDAISSWLMFRGAFVDQAFPLDGYRSGVAPFYIPDLLGLFALYAMGIYPVAAMMFMPLVISVISALGWIAVCTHLYGPSATRYVFVILLHAMTYLFVAAGPSDVHGLSIQIVSHFGTWSCVPWLLFLAMLTLEGRVHPVWPASGLAVLLALVAASDLVIVPWFAGPMLLILALFTLPHLGLPARLRLTVQIGKPRLLMASAAIACGIPAGVLLDKASPFVASRNVGGFLTADFQKLLDSFATHMHQLAEIAIRNPISATLWALFAAIAVWRFFVALKGKQQDEQRAANALFGVPAGAAHAAMALYFPIAAVLSVAAVVLTGNVGTAWATDTLVLNLRYVLPLSSIPLFIGWSLLPWNHAGLLNWTGNVRLAATAFMALLAGGMAYASYAPLSRFDIYSSPFHDCFSSAARRLGWKGGISTHGFNDLIVHPTAGVKRHVQVGVLRSQNPGESLLYLDWQIHNRHWFDGAFQYVVVNGYKGRVVYETPYDENSPNCPINDHYDCIPRGQTALILDERAAQGAFGPPQEVVECYGIGFYHYDPPIRLDYANVPDPDLTRVGKAF